MKYRILCEVSGGVSGYSQAYLKESGAIREFCDPAEAETKAAELNKRMNGPHARATFRYTVKDFTPGAELLESHRYTGQCALDLD